MSSIAERIKDVRKETGLTADEFGEKIGVGTGMVTRFENEQSSPREETLLTLCYTFGIGYSWMAEGKGENKYFNVDEIIHGRLLEELGEEELCKLQAIVRYFS